MVELAREAWAAARSSGKRVAVLGATFKPDSDDVRDSPALNVAGQIHLQGGQVTVYDPKGMDNARRLFPTLGVRRHGRWRRCAGADVVLHLTEWREFRELDPAALGEVGGRTGSSWTAATPSTRRCGARPAGRTGRWGARPPDGR